MASFRIPGLEQLRTRTLGDPRVTVAVLDGAADLSHPCFADADLYQLGGFAASRPTAHGTHVASLLFGHGAGVDGLAPSCHGLIIPIFEESDDGIMSSASQLNVARAIREAAAAGAQLINVSGGQLAHQGRAESFLEDAVRHCAESGVLIIAAAGNDGCECSHIPAALPSVLAVGAMDEVGEPLELSNWGYGSVGILAPGAEIRGAAVGGGTVEKTGTSFATPLVTAAAALLLSEQLARGMDPDPQAVRAALLVGAAACEPQERSNCERFLAGSIDVHKARQALGLARRSMPRQAETKIHYEQEGALSMSEKKDPGQTSEAAVDPTQFVSAYQATTTAEDLTLEFEEGITAADCGGSCGGPRLVYALGELGYDLATEARRDSLLQSMGTGSVYEPADLLKHLDTNPWQAEALIWTLQVDATPIYAIQPLGAYAEQTYARLREFLKAQLTEGVERVSIPGYRSGRATLFSGQQVPVIVPELRGMYSWSTAALVDAVAGAKPADKQAPEQHEVLQKNVRNFLDRIYYELRNLGVSPEERAVSYAATNAFQATQILQEQAGSGMELDAIEVEKSPICRPGSECWDVKLTFFNPRERLTVARRIHRFTVDVSDVIPVTVGPVREWSIY